VADVDAAPAQAASTTAASPATSPAAVPPRHGPRARLAAVRRWRRPAEPRTTPTPRLLAARALVALSVGLVGFLLTAQLRTQRVVTQRLETESEQDLTRIFASLNEEGAALRDEVSELRLELAALQSSAARDQLAREAARRQLEELEILAGVVAARGPGVAVRISDPKTAFSFEMLLDLVQELRDAGAEAIAVNGHRVGAATAFAGAEAALAIDGAEARPPYEVVAIGDPGTLEVGLRIPGGAVDTIDALDGAEVTVERRSEVRVPALERPPVFKAANPVK
jgi:uncharacterized protein YlxW (UPF0749 family)